MLRVESVTIVRPNPARRGAESWSKDWQGYLRLSLGDGDGFRVMGLEWSVTEVNGRLRCRFKRSGQYGPTVSPEVTELADRVAGKIWRPALAHLESRGRISGSWSRKSLAKLLTSQEQLSTGNCRSLK